VDDAVGLRRGNQAPAADHRMGDRVLGNAAAENLGGVSTRRRARHR
jgi:hypothetical protein